MATKVSVFGQETENKKGKPIEFIEALSRSGGTIQDSYYPSEYENVVLYSKAKQSGHFDIILAYDSCRGKESVFLGHWNDGFVE